MKKTLRALAALAFALALITALAVPAFAEGPGAADIAATGDDRIIAMPREDSYLSSYETRYVDVGLKHSDYAHVQPGTVKDEVYMPFVYHGERVTVLAEQNGYSCILYRTNLGERHAAWVRSEVLSADFPGRTESIGSAGGELSVADADVSLSRDRFAQSGRKYTVLTESVENCVGFTLDYQLLGRGGMPYSAVLGPRTVYVRDGEEWIEVGQFEYSERGSVHVEIGLDEPITLTAVATAADCWQPYAFEYRQFVLDVRTD